MRGNTAGAGVLAGWALGLVLLAAGVGWGADLETYFPVKEGFRWEYQVLKTEDLKGLGDESFNEDFVYIVTNFAPRPLKERQVFPKKGEFAGGSGEKTTISFFVVDKESVYEWAEQGAKDPEPKFYEFPLYYLKAPLTAGAAWEVRTYADLDETVKITQTAVIDSISDTITVPAGNFAGCIKVRAAGTTTTTLTDLPGTDKGTETEAVVSTEELSWFAPNVGLVRNIAKEAWKRKADGAVLATREMVMNLKSYKKPEAAGEPKKGN